MPNLPHITAVCPTFARVKCLENAIACFLAQDYAGPKKMVVLNSCVRQKLAFDHPEVVIVNLPFRPATIGETRNALNAIAPDGLLVHWDDDDAYLKNHLSNFAQAFSSEINHGWVWLDRELYMEGDKIRGITPGTCNIFAYTKQAWQAVGGFARMNTGEDRNFLGRVTTAFAGVKVGLDNQSISFIRRWGQGESVYHLSGEGEDKPGQKDGMTRAGEAADIRIGCMAEPQGEILLNPKMDFDYERLAAQFTGSVACLTNARRGRVAMVSLGHMGDIINVLPIALHIYRTTGRKPLFISTKQYGGMVLDGCSYLEPLLLDIPDTQILDALAIAGQRAEIVLNCQVYGHGYVMDRVSKSYNVEQWRMCGFEDRFSERLGMKRVFDLTDDDREEALMSDAMEYRLGTKGKPLMVVHLTGGHTSPFKDGKKLLDRIVTVYGGDFSIIDLEPVRAKRIYDMGIFFAEAYVLITSDTFILHLASDFDIPVVAIVNDCECFGKWMQTVPQCNTILELPYSTADARSEEIAHAISKIDMDKPYVGHSERFHPDVASRNFYHAVEIHDDRGMEESSRKAIARKSWDFLYNTRGVLPCHYTNYVRTAQSIGDQRPLPFFKDVLAQAMEKANPKDIIIFTNDDVILQNGTAEAVEIYCSIWGACTAMRTDFKRETAPPPNMAPEDIAAKGERHLGRDLFAATKEWLTANWDEIGDFILGAQLWDLAIAALVRSKVGHKLNRKNMEERVTCAELPNGYVYHQHHQPLWASMPGMNPAHRHNSECFKKWAAVHDPGLVFIGGDI
jgi:hypothetical protein